MRWCRNSEQKYWNYSTHVWTSRVNQGKYRRFYEPVRCSCSSVLYSTASCSPRIRPWVQVTNFVMDIVKPYHGLLADLLLPRYEISTTRGRCQSSSGSWQGWKTKLIFDVGRRTFMNLRKLQYLSFFRCPLRMPTFAKWYQITERVADWQLEMRESEHAGDLYSTKI